MTLDDEELTQIQRRVENCSAISGAPQLSALFRYLWEHRHERARPKAIWEEGGLRKLCRAKEKDTKGFDYGDNVRTAIADLRGVLKRYFVADGNSDTWHIELPPIVPGTGYKLECLHVVTARKQTTRFWQPHLKGDRQISIVHVEQLFFHRREEGYIFRYYDCNEEHRKDALAELNLLHGKEHPEFADGGLTAIYPYVAKGDAAATHLISKWFANYASVQITPTVTRDIDHDDGIDEHSLILFGSATSNRFVRRLLQRHEDLPIILETRSRVRISAPLTPQEKQQIADLEKKGVFRVLPAERGSILDFSSGTYWPAILTRLPNPHLADIPTTVFNTDFGMAVCALAAIVTNEPRLRRSFERLELPEAPEYFQFLYCVEARSHGPKQVVEPIAWYRYDPRGI